MVSQQRFVNVVSLMLRADLNNCGTLECSSTVVVSVIGIRILLCFTRLDQTYDVEASPSCSPLCLMDGWGEVEVVALDSELLVRRK